MGRSETGEKFTNECDITRSNGQPKISCTTLSFSSVRTRSVYKCNYLNLPLLIGIQGSYLRNKKKRQGTYDDP